jgi:peptidoglycan/LPS O-acetylase OafA/YrhL
MDRWPVFHLNNNTAAANASVYTLTLIGSSSLLAWTLADKAGLRAFLTWAPLRFIGRISYTMYLIGSMTKVVLLRYFHSAPLVLGLDIAASVIWATLSWYLMEKPLLRLSSRLKFDRKRSGISSPQPQALELAS